MIGSAASPTWKPGRLSRGPSSGSAVETLRLALEELLNESNEDTACWLTTLQRSAEIAATLVAQKARADAAAAMAGTEASSAKGSTASAGRPVRRSP